jgi:hypothetical protein
MARVGILPCAFEMQKHPAVLQQEGLLRTLAASLKTAARRELGPPAMQGGRYAIRLVVTIEFGGPVLPISLRIVEAHSGELRVESKAGVGAIAIVWLPV